MTSPRRLVASRFPTRFLGTALVVLQRQWRATRFSTQDLHMTGVIVGVRWGSLQEGVLTLDVDGIAWVVVLGPLWRCQHAGLSAPLLAPGQAVTVSGHRHVDPTRQACQATQVTVDGRTYDLRLPLS